jgi:hypothetical protein
MRIVSVFIFVFTSLCFSQTLISPVNLPSGTYWTSAYGLAYENGKYWISSSSSSTGRGILYAVDSTGVVVDTVTVSGYPTLRESQGIAFDGTNFWYVERKTARCDLFKISPSGVVLDSIIISTINGGTSWYLGGAGWDGSGLWISVYSPDAQAKLYKINVTSKQIVDTIQTYGTQPQGITFKADTLFYVIDDNDGDDERVYAVDLISEDTLFSFAVPGQLTSGLSPRGLAWDGKFFWLLANPLSGTGKRLYKYELTGKGTPGINLITKTVDFLNVQIDSVKSAEVFIQNFGNADLIIDSVFISNNVFTLNETLPHTIPQGETHSLTISFAPSANTAYNDSILLFHNDPTFNYSKVTVKGVGVYTAAYISVSSAVLNYGDKRFNSTSYKELTITNNGSDELIVDSIKISTTNYFTEFAVLPIHIDSVQSATFRVWFHPTSYTTFNDTLILRSNASNTPVIFIPLTGTGITMDSTLGTKYWEGNIPDNPATSFDDYQVDALKSLKDINGDGVDEIVVCTENYYTTVFNGNSSGNGDILWKFSSFLNSNDAGSVDWAQCLQTVDINLDGVEDVVIGTAGGNESVFALDGKTGSVIWEHGDPVNYDNGDIMGVDVKRDWNNDSYPDVLVSASGNESTGNGRFSVILLNGLNGNIIWTINQSAQQKLKYMVASTDDGGAVGSRIGSAYEVFGFNKTGQLIWSYPTIGSPWSVREIVDLDANGTSDIIAGDISGNVYALSGDAGIEIWRKNIGNVFIEDLRIIADVNQSGYPDILVSGINPNVYVLEGKTGATIWNQNTGGNILGIGELGDMTGDNIPEVATASLNDMVHVFEAKAGGIIFTYDFGTPAEHITKIGDIDGNYSKEFVAGSRDGKLVAFSGGTDAFVPVELTSLSASAEGNVVTLYWTTASELNNKGFSVERKSRDGDFSEVAFIEGKGTTSENQFYVYHDKDVQYGLNCYRLKQVDFDGTFEYSKEVEVNVGLPVDFSLSQNYPNPFNPSTVINYSTPVDANVVLTIFNILGEEIKTLVNESVKAGIHKVEWNGTNNNNISVPSGIYFYRIEANNPSVSKKFNDVKKMMILK